MKALAPSEKTHLELKNLNINDAENYFQLLNDILKNVCVTPNASIESIVIIDRAIKIIICRLRDALLYKRKVIAIGNGGSATIAMHVFADYANAGGLQTMDLMNPALVTCTSNDYGYEQVFAKTIERSAQRGDILFAISSSGKSSNIIAACEAAMTANCEVITFSGFDADNPLRKLGCLNFYVSSTHYGFVELAHQSLLHCILDLFCQAKIEHGWTIDKKN